MNVGDVFLDFFFSDLVFLKPPACRIDWYGIEAMRGTSALEAAISGVVSLLMGAINDRGWAIATVRMLWESAVVPKVRSEIRECQDMKRR